MSDPRVLVIGLDGGTLDLVEPWARAGLLPNLARLMDTSCYGPLTSVMPVLSPAAWASFMTGVNPGRHGIYDFVQRQPNGYGPKLVLADQIRAPTLWHLLGRQSKRSVVINVPMTYPPESINGILVSGLGTPDFRPYATPHETYQELQAAGYRVNKSVFFRPGQEQRFISAVNAVTDLHAQTALRLMQEQAWSLFVFVLRDTDEMAHFFWKQMDSGHPLHNPVTDVPYRDALLRYYQKADHWVGELVHAAGPDVHVCILSDHGMGPLYKDVYLNEWLRQHGFQSLRTVGQPGHKGGWLRRAGITRAGVSGRLQAWGLHRVERWLRYRLGRLIHLVPRDRRPELADDVDWARTQAYSFGYHGQVFLNLAGREPVGQVSPDQYERIREQLVSELLRWSDPETGSPVVTRLHLREQVFSGPSLNQAPDVVLLMRDLAYITRHGFEWGREPGTIFSAPNTHESGSHREHGLLVMHSAGQQTGQRLAAGSASIMDLTPTILALLGAAVPAGLDGRVLTEWLSSPLTVEYLNGSDPGARTQSDALNPDDEAEVMDRLRQLGYLG